MMRSLFIIGILPIVSVASVTNRVKIATESGVSDAEVSSAALDYVKAIDIVKIKDVEKQSEIAPLPKAVIAEILSIALEKGLTDADIEEINKLAKVIPLPPAKLVEVYALAKMSKIPVSEIVKVFSVATEKGVPLDVVAKIFAISTERGVDIESKLVEIAAVALENKLPPAAIAPILRLTLAKSILESRFDTLSAETFSTLWRIKIKGKIAEKRGENTDELWKEYWEVFRSSASGAK